MKVFVLSIGIALLGFLGLMNMQVYGQINSDLRTGAVKGIALLFEHSLNVNNSDDAKKLEEFSIYLKEQFGKTQQMTHLRNANTYAMYFNSSKSSEMESIAASISQKFSFIKINKMGEDEFAVKYPIEAQLLIGGQSSDPGLPQNTYFPNDPGSKSVSKRKN